MKKIIEYCSMTDKILLSSSARGNTNLQQDLFTLCILSTRLEMVK